MEKNVFVAVAEAPSQVKSAKPVWSMFVMIVIHRRRTKGRFRSQKHTVPMLDRLSIDNYSRTHRNANYEQFVEMVTRRCR
jgi:hypothetical protein